ncbi:MAG: substrate-binding domain-containing protein [Desulfohalobiaceae bacterium]|nr:substrate-binding domain-containing protein [Desulfohalobiaceae bacterium]
MRLKLLLLSMIGAVLLLAGFSSASFAADQPQFNEVYGQGDQVLRIATGSPGALGLLREMAMPFCAANNCQIKWLKRGSGASLKALQQGLVDVALVHAPQAEKQAVEEGWATGRTLLGSNQFYLVGPPSDPANIRGAGSASEAFQWIAKAEAPFLSRADNSGTHKKEMHIWDLAGVTPKGEWYIKTHDFMGPTLMRADKTPGYFMTDSSTFLVKESRLKNLAILFKDDPILINVYHGLMVHPAHNPKANDSLARKFLRHAGFGPGQKVYRTFGLERFNTPLYEDAFYAQQFEH